MSTKLADGRSLLGQDEVKKLAEKAGVVPAKMKNSTMRKLVKKDKIGEVFEEDTWDDFFKHLEDKKCSVLLMPGSEGYMKIQRTPKDVKKSK